MMIKSVILRSSCPLFLETKDLHCPRSSSFATTVRCSSRSSDYNIPKLEPFSRNKFERVVKDPPLIEKCENELADYCCTLEGDESYSCWKAYFELKDLEHEVPKEDVEKLILQAGGVKSLIGCLHGIAAMHKDRNQRIGLANSAKADNEAERPFPIPDGLPKTLEELEEEERAKMPDSPFTRLLRTMKAYPSWYTPAPDHETD